MYQSLYDFFKNTLFGYSTLNDLSFTIGGVNLTFLEWLCHTLSIIMLVLIFVACVMFILKIVKVVGRLFMGA